MGHFISKKRNRICMFFFFFVYIYTGFLYGKSVPSWYQNKNLVYPSDFYISAIGEGSEKAEAEIDAVSGISKYFQISTETYDNLLKEYNQTESDTFYSFYEHTEINQKTTISSKADFFGVQFAEGFFIDGKYMTLAYINRDDVFEVYRQRIKLNESKMRSLLLIAEDYNNPIYGYEAAVHGLPIAQITEQYIKMAKLVKKTTPEYFAESESCIERINTAYQICKTNLVFKVVVQNDYEQMIEHTVSKLLESNGYAVSNVNGICEIPITISVDREDSSAGIFLWCGITINLSTGTGKTFFSYSRTFPKKGAKTESMAYRRAYQEIENEINNSFLQEFKNTVRIYE